MKVSKDNAEHYKWGADCSGWHLVNSQGLSVIEELMPPNTSEKMHYHSKAQQFFRIINGNAIFEIGGDVYKVRAGEGIKINAGLKHRIINQSNENLEFIVISQPTTRGDRIDLE